MPLLTNTDKNKIVCVLSLLRHIPLYGYKFNLTYEYGILSLVLYAEDTIYDIINSKELIVSPLTYNEMTRKYTTLTLQKLLSEFETLSVLLYKYDNYIELGCNSVLLNFSTIIERGQTLWDGYSGRLILYLMGKHCQ